MRTRHLNIIESATGVVIEALEQRRVLSVALDHGLLVVRGTAGDDQLQIYASHESDRLEVRDNGLRSLHDVAQITGIVIQGGDGNDLLSDWGDLALPMTISGGAGDDTLIGGPGHDLLRGGSGEDLMFGAPGSYGEDWDYHATPYDRVMGPDTIRGADARDDFQPEAGDDDFHGAAVDRASVTFHKGVLRVNGTIGNDVFNISVQSAPCWRWGYQGWGVVAGVNAVSAQPVNWPDVASIQIEGKGGNDVFKISQGGSMGLPAIVVDENGFAQNVVAPGNYELDGSGLLRATDRYGKAVLRDGVLTILGTDAGEEIMIGTFYEPGFVWVHMNGWAAAFRESEVQAIQIYAGGGNDLVEIYNLATAAALHIPMTIDGGAGDDELGGQSNRDELDLIIPGPYTDMGVTLIGGDGNDTLGAGVGPDVLEGGAGDDELWAAYARSTLLGGDGNDVLWGGYGAAVLLGEGGDDTLYLDPARNPYDGGAGLDRVYAFDYNTQQRTLIEQELPSDPANQTDDGQAALPDDQGESTAANYAINPPLSAVFATTPIDKREDEMVWD
jgi:Ca2+-binding RTX toxin-like protein